MMEALESVDRLMNRIDDNKNYSRLLSHLAKITHEISIADNPFAIYVIASLTAYISDCSVSDEEKAIMKCFLENPNTRPGILASCYSRVISANFKIHYSV